MVYEVPTYRVNKLVKMIERAIKKGANISYLVIDVFNKEYTITVSNNDSHTAHEVMIVASCTKIEINGEYKENGWEFVATIEHTPNGNIIRCINSSYESMIPSKYLTCGPECEHCHKERNRKDTYLVYNSELKEFKQVGKMCLLDFTKGLTPDTCEAFASVFNYCENCEEFEDDEFMGGYCSSSNFGFSIDRVKKLAYGIVKKFGYVKSDMKNATIDIINECLIDFHKIDEYGIVIGTDDDIKAIDDYAQSIQDEYGYMRNAKLAWLNDYASYRDLALVCSFVNVYFKEIAKIEKEKIARETTNYVGNVGDKVNVDVANIRLIYTKGYQVSYYNSSISYVYEIIGKDGNTYIWSSSNELEDGVKSIFGTIKDHKEYKGIKQTILTRCKVSY